MSQFVARRIEYSRDAARTLARIDQATSRRIRQKIEQLAAEPEALANNVRALKSSGGLRRLRVGDWRVLFTETLVVIAVQKVAPRGSAYE
jgi:mRNA interferase RelE/StbE